MYDDDQVFLNLAGHAGLSPEIEQAIRTAVQIGFGPAKTPSCCEEIELNDDQLAFTPARDGTSISSFGCLTLGLLTWG